MKLIKRRKHNFEETIKKCYYLDPSIEEFSRNKDCTLDGRIQKEVEALNKTDSSFKFYEIFDGECLVGYFGIERSPVQCLTTFFIVPEYRQHKKKIWKFVKSHLPRTFFAGLFKVNTRAINFYKKQGGKQIAEIMWENKPSVIFKFER